MKYQKEKYINFTELKNSDHVKIHNINQLRSVRFQDKKIRVFLNHCGGNDVDSHCLDYDSLNIKNTNSKITDSQKKTLGNLWLEIFFSYLETDDIRLNFFEEMNKKIKSENIEFQKIAS